MGIWGFVDLRFGDLGIWGFGDFGIWGFGDLGIWEFGNLGIWGIRGVGGRRQNQRRQRDDGSLKDQWLHVASRCTSVTY